jgi:hypothetical protein
MMKPHELDGLPPLLREVIVTDRALRAASAPPVVPIARGREIRDLREYRGNLQTEAARRWGHSLRGDSTGPARA